MPGPASAGGSGGGGGHLLPPPAAPPSGSSSGNGGGDDGDETAAATSVSYLHSTFRNLVELPELARRCDASHHDASSSSGALGAASAGDSSSTGGIGAVAAASSDASSIGAVGDTGGPAREYGTTATVQQRIEICDVFARYSAGDFSAAAPAASLSLPLTGPAGGKGSADGITGSIASKKKDEKKMTMKMMAHGAVDGYLDLYPGGTSTTATTNTVDDDGDNTAAVRGTSSAPSRAEEGGRPPPPPSAAPSPSSSFSSPADPAAEAGEAVGAAGKTGAQSVQAVQTVQTVQAAGGVILPPLDWNANFRKGYGVQLWVRPHLCSDGKCKVCAQVCGQVSCGGGEGDDKKFGYKEGGDKRGEGGAGSTAGANAAKKGGGTTKVGGKASGRASGRVDKDLERPATVARGRSAALRTAGPASSSAGSLSGTGAGGGGGMDSVPESPDRKKKDLSGAASRAAHATAEADLEAQSNAERNRPKVLYRFATHADNEHGVGVCALLGKWTAYENSDGSVSGVSGVGIGGGGGDADKDEKRVEAAAGITHLQTTLTVYSLPHHKSNPVFFVPSSRQGSGGGGGSGGGSGGSPMSKRRGAGRNEYDDERAAGWDSGSPDNSPRKRYGGGGGDGEDGFRNAAGNIHEANLHQFEMQQQMQQQQMQQMQRQTDAASLATAALILPSDEWSLIGINHVLPYLKRPQISVSVNGDEIMRSELAYPVIPDGGASAAASSSHSTSAGGSDLKTPRASESGSAAAKGGAGGGRASPSLGFKAGGKGGMTGELRLGANADELPPGWMGHCSILDNVFGYGGVAVKSFNSTGSNGGGGSGTSSGRDVKAYAPYHMHMASVALYPEPISPTVQAIVAEFGPNAPPGMVVPPVPCIVQNRDSVVTDGHHSGHSSSSSSGRGGSGGGIAVGRGHKSGRSIGIATSIGVLPPSTHGRDSLRVNIDGGGELSLQKAMGRAVWGWSMIEAISLGQDIPPSSSSGSLSSKASSTGPPPPVGTGRIMCPPSRYNSSIGRADDVPKVGLVQPRPPPSAEERSPHGILGDKGGLLGLGVLSSSSSKGGLYEDFPGSGEKRYDAGGVLRTIGTCRLWNASQMFVAAERQRLARMQSQSPTANLPMLVPPSSTASYYMAYTAADTSSYLLLPLRLALPPPGHVHGLQGKLYRESFWHLEALLDSDSALLAAIIRNLAASLRLSGRCRDDVLQSGAIYTLATLLRRVLLRGYKLGLLGKDQKAAEDKIAQVMENGGRSAAASTSSSAPSSEDGGDKSNAALQEYDDSLDGIIHDQCRPPIIPSLVADAAVELIDACCGPVWLTWHGQGPGISSSSEKSSSRSSNKHRRSEIRHNVIPAALHVRRTSDMAQSVLFGFALDFDLWGGDSDAAAKVFDAIVKRFCVNCPVSSDDNGADIIESIVYGKGGYGWLLRNQMGVQTFLDTIRLCFSSNVGNANMRGSTLLSAADSLSAILKSMLYHSLSSHRSISRGENDIAACITSLTDAPLGSVGAHVVLSALVEMLVEASAIRNPNGGCGSGDEQQSSKSQRLELSSKLGRSLLMASFHDSVAPILLGRAAFSGMSRADIDADAEADPSWTYHWRQTLLIFTWLTSIAGPEGEVSAKSAASILQASGRAGSLAGCLLCPPTTSAGYIQALCFPPLPVPAASSSSGSRDGADEGQHMEDYLKDISRRLRVILHLLPGLVSSLTCRPHVEGKSSENSDPIDARTADVVVDLLTAVSTSFRQIGLDSSSTSLKISGKPNPKAALMAIKAAKEALPPMLTVCVLLDEPIKGLRLQAEAAAETSKTDDAARDTASWVNVSQSTSDLSLPDSSTATSRPIKLALRRDIAGQLRSCQNSVLQIAEGLVIDAMQAGTSQSTMVWSIVLKSLKDANGDSEPSSDPIEEGGEDANEARTPLARGTAHDLLCRIASSVLLKVVKSTSNPWTSVELCGGVARLCDLIEEKCLLDGKLEVDQVCLLCSLIRVMKSGRESLGWCQISIPTNEEGAMNDMQAGVERTAEEDKPPKRQDESLTDKLGRYDPRQTVLRHELKDGSTVESFLV